ncbi:MAG: response regulator [Betaproteobacteria bacterium]
MNLNQRISTQAAPPVPQLAPVVFVVDDDISARESLERLIRSMGWQAKTFASAEDYLARQSAAIPSCLILDIGLPDINGLDLQQRIAEDFPPPIIFVTGRADIPSSVRAIKAGAIDFLTKPFDEVDLLRAINTAIDLDRDFSGKRSELAELRRRWSSLTPREREVLPLVVSGLLNKQTAWELGISEVTAQVHRARIMKKMKAGSFAELVRMAGTLDLPVNPARRHLFRTTESMKNSQASGVHR